MANSNQKENDRRTKIYLNTGVSIFSALGTYLAYMRNVESGISFAQQISNLSTMAIIYILTPLIIGGVVIWSIHIRFKLKDKFQSLIDRIENAESELEKLDDQAEKHITIENNHFLQMHFNRLVADSLEEENPELNRFLSGDTDSAIEKLVEERNNKEIAGQRAIRIARNFKFKPEKFKDPLKA